jgi:hypothetical protein
MLKVITDIIDTYKDRGVLELETSFYTVQVIVQLFTVIIKEKTPSARPEAFHVRPVIYHRDGILCPGKSVLVPLHPQVHMD